MVSEVTKQNLIDCKINIIRAFPFMSFMVMSSEYKIDSNAKTMYATVCKGKTIIGISESFMNDTLVSLSERSFVIAHEIMHLFFLHVGRQITHNYNPKLWNVATDFFINNHLIALESDKLTFPKAGGLKDEKYAGMSSDEIYYKILEENGNDIAKALEQFGEYGDGDGCPFDEVSRDALSDAEITQLKGKIATSLANSRMQGSGAASNLMAAIEEMLEPTLNWVDILQNFVTSSYEDNLTYNRCNRRSTDVIFPCLKDERISVVVGIDTSGSMSDTDINDALSELRGIVEAFSSWNVTLLSCDTEPHVIGEYASEIGDSFATIDLALIGGGGTDMDPIVRYGEDMYEPPHAIIILTDGYMDDIINITDIPSIIVITRSGNATFDSTSSQVINIK